MQLDGEWRLGMARTPASKFEIGTAPLPVADDQADEYGKGYLTGTIIGIAATSKKQNAAWELVKYMTTDTDGGRRLRQRHPQRAVHACRAEVART